MLRGYQCRQNHTLSSITCTSLLPHGHGGRDCYLLPCRQFSMKSLGQMKTVYSQALNYHYEKNIPGDYDKRSCYQLIVESNLTENGLVACSDSRLSHLSTASLVYRRKTFNSRLRSIVMNHHRQFLAGLKPPVEIADQLVFRWHCDFCLDSVPDIEEGDLPTPPSSGATFCCS